MKKLILTILFSFFLLTPAWAADLGDAFGNSEQEAPIDTIAKEANFQSTENNNIENLIRTALNLLFSVIGAIFIALTILAGFRWMIAEGNQEQVTKAKHSIKSSLIGIVVVLLAYAITYFVFSVFIPKSLNT
jgi:uncharacterized membrane protein YraQ (UPF0718 family)